MTLSDIVETTLCDILYVPRRHLAMMTRASFLFQRRTGVEYRAEDHALQAWHDDSSLIAPNRDSRRVVFQAPRRIRPDAFPACVCVCERE